MRLSPPAKRYEHVAVLHLYDPADPEAVAGSKILEDVWKEYNFSVKLMDVGNTALKPGDRTTKIVKEVRRWWRQEEPYDSDQEDDFGEMLLIVCYFGHGGVKPEGLWDFSLDASSQSQPEVIFNITTVQKALGQFPFGDVLCILECCDGHIDGMDELHLPENEKRMIFEIAAAGTGDIEAPTDGTAFSARLASHLKDNKSALTVEERG